MEDKLAEAVKEHRANLENVGIILRGTRDLEAEVSTLLGRGASSNLVTKSEQISIERVLDQKIIIAVFGERNSGKSSLINELLCQTIVPVSSLPCTCRGIRIKYSKEPYICLLNSDGTEKDGTRKELEGQGSKDARRRDSKEVQSFVKLKEEQRQDETLISEAVEIGLNDPILSNGLEFVDSPGKNENAKLNKVVEQIARDRKIAVLIYVIDGRSGVRIEDCASINQFRESCPGTAQLYVCSKIDDDKRAAEMDRADSDDESDSGEDLDKLAKVREGLEANGLLDRRSQSTKLHGLALKDIKKAREKGSRTGYFDDFLKFRENLSKTLELHLHSALSGAIGTLMRCHSRLFYYFSQKQKNIDKENEEMTRMLSSAQKSENALFEELTGLVQEKKDEIRSIVDKVVEDVERGVEEEIKYFSLSRRAKAHDLLLDQCKAINLSNSVLKDEKFLLMHACCQTMRSSIINYVISRLEMDIGFLLEDYVAPTIWPKVIDTMEALENPTLKRNMESVYQFVGYESDYKEDTKKSLIALMYSLVTAVRDDLNSQLQETYNLQTIVDVASKLHKDGAEPQTHRVADILTGMLDANRLTDSIIRACRKKMLENHNRFEKSIENIKHFKDEVCLNTNIELTASTIKIVSSLAQLEIRNHALKFKIIRGSLQRGRELSQGQHCIIYQYKKGWGFMEKNKYAIRSVIFTDKTAWQQSFTALYYAYNCTRCPNLLRIYGWLLPEPNVLEIVVDKAKERLNKVGQTLAPTVKLSVALDVAKGLDNIHSSGFIFNNMEPSKVLIMEDGRAVINTCKGNYQILRGNSAELDIHQFGKLLLWMYGGSLAENKRAKSMPKWSRPAGFSDDRLWKLTERCLSRPMTLTMRGIVQELKSRQQVATQS
ncbi:dual serine/threonine and tyrosine protein kinase-like [Ptychodera flava]|uniref:dual serine/threonine and tyrosine protein kinase-like n=1 Tax=Ptychodera flava TaxID=63121 RepID=UPI00396A20B4